MVFTTADSYVFSGHGVEGSVTLARPGGEPTAALTVDGTDIEPVTVTTDSWQIQVTGTLRSVPDLETVEVTVTVPLVNLDGRVGTFAGFAVLTTRRTSIGGPRLVSGSLSSFDLRPLGGQCTLSTARETALA